MKFHVTVMFQRKNDRIPAAMTYPVDAEDKKAAMNIAMQYACRENGVSRRQVRISVKEAV